MTVKVRTKDIVDFIPTIELIKNTNLLSDEQKKLVLEDLLKDMPLDMFSSAVANTKNIVTSLIKTEMNNGTKKITAERKKPIKGKSSKQPLQSRNKRAVS
jgi:hypothetical protein